MTTRFVAIGVPPVIRAAVDTALAPVRAQRPEYAWTDPAGWHLTLAFLGGLPDAARPEVVTAVRHAVATAALADELPTELALGPAASFGGRVLIIRIEDAVDDPVGKQAGGRVAALGGRIQAALIGAGFPVDERPVRPHVTLARARRGRAIDDALVARVQERIVPGRFRVETVGLWSSHPRRGAPSRYLVDDEVAFPP